MARAALRARARGPGGIVAHRGCSAIAGEGERASRPGAIVPHHRPQGKIHPSSSQEECYKTKPLKTEIESELFAQPARFAILTVDLESASRISSSMHDPRSAQGWL